MFESDEPDWLPPKEEVPPRHLEEKWQKDETTERGFVECPKCGKYNKKDALECIYCNHQFVVDSGFLGWITYLTTKSFLGFVLFVFFLLALTWLLMTVY